MGSFYKVASGAIGVLSLVLLIKQGWDLGLIAPLETLIEYYRRLMDVLFGWSEPCIRDMLHWLQGATGITLHLSPEWKHLFFLLGIYFTNDATNLMSNRTVRPGTAGADRRYFYSGLYRLVFGVVLALCVGIGIGSIGAAQDQFLVMGGSAMFAIIGVWLFEVFTAFLGAQLHRQDLALESGLPENSWWDEFFSRVGRGSWHAIFGIGAVAIGLLLIQTLAPNPKNPAALGTGILAVMIFFFACFWLYRGLRHSYLVAKRKQQTWRETIATSRNVNLGRSMLRIYVGALVLLVGSAGLQFVGL